MKSEHPAQDLEGSGNSIPTCLLPAPNTEVPGLLSCEAGITGSWLCCLEERGLRTWNRAQIALP